MSGRFLLALIFCVLTLALPAFAQEVVTDHTQKGLTDALIAQGPIGIVCLILLVASFRVYTDARADKKEALRKDEEHAKALAMKDQQQFALSLEYAKDRAASTEALQRFLRYIERIEGQK